MKHIYLIAIVIAIVSLSQVSYVVAQESDTPYEVEYETPHRYKDFRFSIGGGYSYRLGKVLKDQSAELQALDKKLRHGFTIDADAQYFF